MASSATVRSNKNPTEVFMDKSSREYKAIYDREFRKKRWAMIFDYFGGRKCQACGVESEHPIYDLHHRDPSAKDFSIGDVIRRKWKTLLPEVAKCDLLCSNCHRIRHDVERKEQREVLDGSN